jgi:preprotein translocase subunit SecD
MEALLSNMKQRLDVYGLSDLVIRSAGDLSGNQFIVVEIAGATEEEVQELLAKQGKFEATIGNTTVFLGGNDITYVCRSAQCSGIDPQIGCRRVQDGYTCRFRFTISLSQEAAQRQADTTRDLEIIYDPSGQEYLSEDLNLYLDDSLIDTLKISADLKGQAATDIAISGSGLGISMQDARQDALKNMKKLQTVLITGSLPVKLNIIKTDTISPSLGKEFLGNALLIGLFSMIGVTFIVYLRYRKIKIAVPIIIIIISEILLILGVAALLGQNLDIAGIAGIIVAIGTGVDDQIVITDETLRKEKEKYINWKQKLKKAFFIVVAAYVATMASMIPLLFAGAGLLRGFAITTMIGVTNGVLITRPAFSKIIEILLKEEVE